MFLSFNFIELYYFYINCVKTLSKELQITNHISVSPWKVYWSSWYKGRSMLIVNVFKSIVYWVAIYCILLVHNPLTVLFVCWWEGCKLCTFFSLSITCQSIPKQHFILKLGCKLCTFFSLFTAENVNIRFRENKFHRWNFSSFAEIPASP